jgi:hypothetical protein
MNAIKIIVSVATIVMIGLYIAALATKEYATISFHTDNTTGPNALSLKVNINLQSKQNIEVTSASGTTTPPEETLCSDSSSSTQCSKFRAAYAFTIMAVIFLGPATACWLLGDKLLIVSLASYLISAVFGMIGWAIFYGGIDRAEGSNFIKGIYAFIISKVPAATFNNAPTEFSIGFSQAFAITAWCLGMIVTVLVFLQRNNSVGRA